MSETEVDIDPWIILGRGEPLTDVKSATDWHDAYARIAIQMIEPCMKSITIHSTTTEYNRALEKIDELLKEWSVTYKATENFWNPRKGATTNLSAKEEKARQMCKKSIHELVVKASRDYNNSLRALKSTLEERQRIWFTHMDTLYGSACVDFMKHVERVEHNGCTLVVPLASKKSVKDASDLFVELATHGRFKFNKLRRMLVLETPRPAWAADYRPEDYPW